MPAMRNIFYAIALISSLVIGPPSLLPMTSPAQTATDPVFVGAGDISNCNNNRDELTAQLLDGIEGTVFTLGDNAYPDGTASEFTDCYDPTWGRHKSRTRPSPGNHDYHTAGAEAYFRYFGSVASPLDNNCTSNCRGYYSYNLGNWHIIALNSEIDHSAGSVQEQWLRADLAANQRTCTLAYWHKPRFSSGRHGSNAGFQPFWQALYDYGADVVLNGHNHAYERFAPQNPTGEADPSRGIREFVVGTGGAGLYSFPSPIQPNSEVHSATWGVLKLTLHATSYDWEFIPIAGQTFTDSGSDNCVEAGTVPAETYTPPPGSLSQIFNDSFESGTLSAWSSSTTDDGDLRVTATAAMLGNRGLQILIDDSNSIYVTDDTPAAESHYLARFYFNQNSIKMASGDNHYIFRGFSGKFRTVLKVQLRFRNDNYQVRAALRNDDSSWINSKWFTITNSAHLIELDWRAATGEGKNDGGLALWIDGIQQANLTGVDNDTQRIDRVRLGAVGGIDNTTTGKYFFDGFESWR